MKKLKHFLALVILQSACGFLLAKDFNLSGTVIDTSSHQGIPNVNVYIKGTAIGTSTDQNGYFILTINDSLIKKIIAFSHIAYQDEFIPVEDLILSRKVELREKSIQFDEIYIKGKRETFDYNKGLNNIVSNLPVELLDAKGFTDAGDVLSQDQSITIDENLSGRKTISIRGTNDYEVMILYDGIRINSNFDNLFDLSLIDVSSLEQIDIIKGGNSATFGSFGSSAAINFIPKLEQDYTFRFQQRFGTYNSGDWYFNVYENLKNFKVFSSIKRSGANYQYLESLSQTTNITKTLGNNILNASWGFGPSLDGGQKNLLSIKYLNTTRDYDNQKYSELLSTKYDIQSLKYTGHLLALGKSNINLTHQRIDESHSWNAFAFDGTQNIQDDITQFTAEQIVNFTNLKIFVAYQLERSKLDYCKESVIASDSLSNINSKNLGRKRTGFSTSAQFFNSTGQDYYALKNILLNITLDRIDDKLPLLFDAEDGGSAQKNWRASSYALSASFEHDQADYQFEGYSNYSFSYTIPTIHQQISSRFYRISSARPIRLLPELKKSLELGGTFSRAKDKESAKIEITSAFFYNKYLDKFRQIYLSGSPLTFFDNYSESQLIGTENIVSFGIIPGRLTTSFALSKYFINDPIAFPFQPEEKYTSNLILDFKNFNVLVTWFHESARIGNVLSRSGYLEEITLPDFSNFDLHITKSFQIWRTSWVISFSGRNILSKETALEGIAIRDRRLYVSFGVDFK